MTLRSNSFWMIVGNLAYAAARWLALILIAKFGSQAMVGQYAWAIAVCLPAITLCRFGGRILITTDAKSELNFGQYLGFTLASTVAGMAIVAGVLAAWPPMEPAQIPPLPGLPAWLVLNWPQQVVSTYLISLVLIVAVWNSLESISEIFSGLFQRYDRLDYMAVAYILQAVAMCSLMAVALIATHSILFAAVGLALAAALRLLAVEIPYARHLVKHHRPFTSTDTERRGAAESLRPEFNLSMARHLLKLGAPLTMVTFLMAYTVAVPRYVLRDWLGDARLGVFGALYALATAPNLLVNSLAQSLTSRLAVFYASQDRARFLKLILRAIMLSLVVSGLGLFVALVAGKLVLSIVYKPEYAADQDVFVILMLFGVMEGLGAVVGTATSSMRQFRVQVPIHLSKLAITYIGMLLVVPDYGLAGAAWVLVFTSLFTDLCYAAICWRQLRGAGCGDT